MRDADDVLAEIPPIPTIRTPAEARAYERSLKLVCMHCGEKVFWGLPRPEDPCIHCGKPIGRDV